MQVDANILYLFILVFLLLLLISKLNFVKKLLKITLILLLYFMCADVFPNLQIPYLYEFLRYVFVNLIEIIEKLLGVSSSWL
ncbi:MAG: hypothetical protein DRJ03_12420 [Chloroflexi bacterium]|nr:MAG: hypothetical protein DRJ03_12420 [Chloroflexota bacterium]